MSALEKIVKEILEQAHEQANGIIDKARQRACEISDAGEADCKEWKRKYDEAAHQEQSEIMSQMQSLNRQSRRRALLEARNQVIDEVLLQAKDRLMEQADKECFKVVEQGNILMNNSVDAIFEAERQDLRDKAYEVLTSGS